MSKFVSEVVALFVTSILFLLDQGAYCSKFFVSHNYYYMEAVYQSMPRGARTLCVAIIDISYNNLISYDYVNHRGDEP